MELIAQVTALCVVGAILSLTVKKATPEFSLLLTLAAAVAVLIALTEPIGQIVEFLRELEEGSGLSKELFLPLYKTMGIALVVRVGSSLCRDAGESALASAVETAGAVCALIVSLPLLRSALSLLMEFLR